MLALRRSWLGVVRRAVGWHGWRGRARGCQRGWCPLASGRSRGTEWVDRCGGHSGGSRPSSRRRRRGARPRCGSPVGRRSCRVNGHVEPGGDAVHDSVGEGLGEGVDERSSTGVVSGSHAAQVPVEFTVGEEVSEGELVDASRSVVGEQLLVADRFEQYGWHDEPAEPQRRGERLAGRAGVDDSVRLETLQRADGGAVVAVVGVVVVLDGDASWVRSQVMSAVRRSPLSRAPVGCWWAGQR